jgi:O-antigen/teichoic acid export membrane protein
MSTRRALFFSFLDRYASLLISIVSSMVLARLLSPAEIGVFSVTMVLLTFVATVRDMGAGQYLVQEQQLTTERIRAVWTVQLGVGVGLACLVLLASNPVAQFYGEPRMRDILGVVALNYALNPFGSLTYAWLMREMRFESVAFMRFFSALSGALISIWLAWRGHGPISLAYGSLGSTIANASVAMVFRPRDFPLLPGIKEIRRVLVFGSRLTFSSIAAVISSSAPELLLGKLQGVAAAGMFSRSVGLVQMFYRLFADAVGTVCLPWFAAKTRENASFAEPFLKATAYVTAFGWSFCLVVIFLAHPIVRVLYGSQWDAAVDLTRLLAAAVLFSVPATLCQTALLSAGAVNTIARMTLLATTQNVVLVATGASMGLLPLGALMIVSAAFNGAMWIRAVSLQLGLSLADWVRALWRSLAVAAIAALAPALVFLFFGAYPGEFVMPLALGLSGALAGFLLAVFVLVHPLRAEFALMARRLSKDMEV